jgi:ABC-type Fe3+/spermidine/putrescine transport system ATPase subunit
MIIHARGSWRSSSTDRVTAAIRPEKVLLSEIFPAGGDHVFPGTIREAIYSGADTQYAVEVRGVLLKSRMLNSKAGHQGKFAGSQVWVSFAAGAVLLLDD